mmetsp:Transcript_25835/g.57009  ORF Transcript_25835/g.57009 Transcript_25835/m.57009 type:complete len:262 (+) Transcript_25835:58-843(+)
MQQWMFERQFCVAHSDQCSNWGPPGLQEDEEVLRFTRVMRERDAALWRGKAPMDTGSDDDTTAPNSPRSVETASLVDRVRAAVLKHVQAEIGGKMHLSTVGNRLPKPVASEMKRMGLKVLDVVAGWAAVEVDGAIIKIAGASDTEAAPVRRFPRGQFLKSLRSGELEDHDLHSILKVAESVYEAVLDSAAGELSTFALGNLLAPGCRAFMAQAGVRLLELLRVFEGIFVCDGVQQRRPVIRLIPGAARPTLGAVKNVGCPA